MKRYGFGLIFITFGMFQLFTPSQVLSGGPAKFTSVYTDLAKECQSALTPAEEKRAAAQGQDIPLQCKGYGGYQLRIDYSCCASILNLRAKNGREDIYLGEQEIGFDQKGRKLEWRLADGKPFAVILRLDKFEDNSVPTNKKVGEVLLVKGLNPADNIDFEIDVRKTANPNEAARSRADMSYQKK